MSRDTSPDHLAKTPVVYRIPGMDEATVRRDVPYRATEAGPLTMDLYYPPGSPQHAASLGVDAQRLALWASSGNVPLALSVLMQEGRALTCAALCYGYIRTPR